VKTPRPGRVLLTGGAVLNVDSVYAGAFELDDE